MEEDLGEIVSFTTTDDRNPHPKRQRVDSNVGSLDVLDNEIPRLEPPPHRRFANFQNKVAAQSTQSATCKAHRDSAWIDKSRTSTKSRHFERLSGASTAPSSKSCSDDCHEEVRHARHNNFRPNEKDASQTSAPQTMRENSLPVWKHKEEILNSLRRNQVTIVVGETGSGKTTQIPQIIYSYYQQQAPGCNTTFRPPVIAITQPRRVAAINLANRVLKEMRESRCTSTQQQTTSCQSSTSNQELNETRDASTAANLNVCCDPSQGHSHSLDPLQEIGGLVGYSVRFQQKVSRQTQIKFVTDGMLLREVMVDPLLRRYRVIIIDEAHERSVRTDILLGLLKLILKRRLNLKVLVMSATLDYHSFMLFMETKGLVVIEGRQHPVTIHQTITPPEEYLESMVNTIIQLHLSKNNSGNILAFLPGQEEIESCQQLLLQKIHQIDEARSRFALAANVVKALQQLKSRKSWECFMRKRWDIRATSDIDTLAVETDNKQSSCHPDVQAMVQSLSPKEMDLLHKIWNCLNQTSVLVSSPAEDQIGTLSVFDQTIKCARELSQLTLDCPDVLQTTSSLTSLDAQKSHLLCMSNDQFLVNLFELQVLTIYAAMPIKQQQEVFSRTPSQTRRVILATNIAETSVTIPGIKYVIDCGLYKVKVYNPRSGVETLAVATISRAMANQRIGRAGREGLGEAFCLYTEQDYYKMEVQAEPEIKRSNLNQIVLQLKSLSIHTIGTFPFLSHPSQISITKSIQFLQNLEALDKDELITPIGKKLISLPLDPEFGKCLLNSIELGCTSEMLTIISVLNTGPIFFQTSKYSDHHQSPELEIAKKKVVCVFGDHLTLLNAYEMWDTTTNKLNFCKNFGLNHKTLLKAKSIRQQIKMLLLSPSIGLQSIPSCSINNGDDASDQIRKCLVKSFPNKIAKLEPVINDQKNNNYRTADYMIESSRTRVSLHPSSTLFGRPNKPQYVVFNELIETSKLYMRDVTAVEPEWLTQFHPHLFIKQHQNVPQQRQKYSHCHSPMRKDDLIKKMRIGAVS